MGLNTNVTSAQSTGNNLSAEMKTYYDKQLIRLASAELVYDRFAQKRPIPKNGGKTIEFRKFSPLSKATTPLSEGVTPDGQNLDVSTVTATVNQYGGYVTISDMLNLTAVDPVLDEAVELLASQASTTLDTVTREILMAGTNVQYGDGTVAGRAALKGGAESGNNYMTVAALKAAVATLKRQNTPKIDGYYVAIMHPDVVCDLISDPEWIAAHRSGDTSAKNLWTGEVGCIAGVKILESTEAKIWANAAIDNTTSSARSVYGTLLFGQNAYGTTDIEGGGLETIIKPFGSGGTSDPLDQRSTAGWKAARTAEILVDSYMVRIETCASHNGSAN